MNNPSKPKDICRRSLLRSVPMIAGVSSLQALRHRACSPKRRPPMKPPNIRTIQKTDSNAQVANFSSCLIHARSWKIPSQRAGGANSSQPSLPKRCNGTKIAASRFLVAGSRFLERYSTKHVCLGLQRTEKTQENSYCDFCNDLALAFSGPVFAGAGAAKTEADCAKAGGTWNATTKMCEEKKM